MTKQIKPLSCEGIDTKELEVSIMHDKAYVRKTDYDKLEKLLAENKKSFREKLHRMRNGNNRLMAEIERLKAGLSDK